MKEMEAVAGGGGREISQKKSFIPKIWVHSGYHVFDRSAKKTSSLVQNHFSLKICQLTFKWNKTNMQFLNKLSLNIKKSHKFLA